MPRCDACRGYAPCPACAAELEVCRRCLREVEAGDLAEHRLCRRCQDDEWERARDAEDGQGVDG